MKKPKITYKHGDGYWTHSEVLIDDDVMAVDDIAMMLSGLIDALINAHEILDSLTYCGADRNIVDAELENIEQALKKAGCEFN